MTIKIYFSNSILGGGGCCCFFIPSFFFIHLKVKRCLMFSFQFCRLDKEKIMLKREREKERKEKNMKSSFMVAFVCRSMAIE